MNVVCVFFGSSPDSDPACAASARTLGRPLAERGSALVYGDHGGLMGVVAKAALGVGG